MNILGIDPSLTGTGIANQHGHYTIKTKASDGDRRLYQIWDEINLVCTRHAIELAVVEDLPTHAHGAGITGMVQGVVRLALQNAGVHYVTVAAATLKKFATGKGNATKPDMRMALFKRAGLDLRDDNQVDAWWLHEMGRHHVGEPTIELPVTHTVALAKVKGWRVEDQAGVPF